MRYAAFFRGINVGGKNIVKMAELKELLRACGFGDVQTYIQSGNAVFDSELGEQDAVDMIAESFEHRFNIPCKLMLRTRDELIGIMKNLPFTEREVAAAESVNPEVEHLYVYLMDAAPAPDAVQGLCESCGGDDLLRAGARELYLLCGQSVRDSKLAAGLSKLKVDMTARNWKTMRKMREMLD